MLALVFGAFVGLMFLGIPIAAAIGFSSFLPQFVDPGFMGNANYILRAVVSGLDSASILAVPLFMLSGAVMSMGGVSKKLFDVFAVFIGGFRAGMPCAVVVTCLFYGAISGSGVATCAAWGRCGTHIFPRCCWSWAMTKSFPAQLSPPPARWASLSRRPSPLCCTASTATAKRRWAICSRPA